MTIIMCSDIFSQADKQTNKQRNATKKHRTPENESYLRYLDPTTLSLILKLSDLTILDLHTLNIVIYV